MVNVVFALIKVKPLQQQTDGRPERVERAKLLSGVRFQQPLRFAKSGQAWSGLAQAEEAR